MPLMRICKWNGCKRLIPYDKEYCAEHRSMKYRNYASKHDRTEYYKEYNKKRYGDKYTSTHERKYKQFYNTDGWLGIRNYVIHSVYCIDVLEFYRTGKIVEGQTVHHIIPLREDWSRRLDDDNLIYLAEHNHRHVHEIYKDARSKAKIQQLLLLLKRKFIAEYGGPGG